MIDPLPRRRRPGAWTLLLLLVAVSFFSPVYSAGEDDWLGFYPLHIGDHWEYAVVYKGKEMQGNVDVSRSYVEDGLEYFVMRADDKDVEYHVAINEGGVFLRRWRYPFPVLRFLKYTVKFEPPVPIIRYPLEVGKRWVYVGRGSVWFMGKDVSISYEVQEEGQMELAVGDVHYFKVSGLINDSKNLYEEIYFYGRGYGYIKGAGRERSDVMVDYQPKLPDQNERKEKSTD